MKIIIEHIIRFDGTGGWGDLLVDIYKETKLIYKQNNKIMADIEQKFDEVFTKLDASTNRLAEQIRDLKGQLTNQGLTAEKEEAILARMEGIASNLDQIGKDPQNPVPEPLPGGETGDGSNL